MRVDLHCHSTWSDGSQSAASVAARAHRRGVELFSLTDHDTTAGAAAAAEVFGPAAVRGVELSCTEDGRTVHLLVYDVEGGARWAALDGALAELARARRERARRIGDRLAALGVPVDVEALLASVRGTVGRPHLARALVAAGWAASLGEAFDRYLGDGGPADEPARHLPLSEGLALARAAGGVASLAHPHTLGDAAGDLVRRFAGAGLGGVEAYYGSYGQRERRRWLALADRHGLVATGGSDFHGGQPPSAPLFGVDLPAERAQRLLAWLGRA